MSNITRHVGQDHLGNRVVVVFRALPEDPEHCLVIHSNTLPDMYHDNIMNIVESTEAQQTMNLYEVLNRRVFGDGQHVLQTLHARGFLKKMSIDQVSLVPMPNRKLPLREANAAIDGVPAQDGEFVSDAPAPQPVPESTPLPVETPSLEGRDEDGDTKAKALGLVEQARLLEADAKRYREEAYILDPSLKAGGRPPKKSKAKKEEVKADA